MIQLLLFLSIFAMEELKEFRHAKVNCLELISTFPLYLQADLCLLLQQDTAKKYLATAQSNTHLRTVLEHIKHLLSSCQNTDELKAEIIHRERFLLRSIFKPKTHQRNSLINTVHLSPEGNILISEQQDGYNQLHTKTTYYSYHPFTILATNSDASVVAAGSHYKPNITVFKNFQLATTIKCNETTAALACSPSGDTLAIATNNNKMHLIHLTIKTNLSFGLEFSICSLALTEEFLCIGDNAGTLHLYKGADPVSSKQIGDKPITHIAASEEYIALSSDTTIEILRLSTLERIASYQLFHKCLGLTLSENGHEVFMCTPTKSILLDRVLNTYNHWSSDNLGGCMAAKTGDMVTYTIDTHSTFSLTKIGKHLSLFQLLCILVARDCCKEREISLPTNLNLVLEKEDAHYILGQLTTIPLPLQEEVIAYFFA